LVPIAKARSATAAFLGLALSHNNSMPDITRQRSGELVRAVFAILIPHTDGMQAKDVLHELRQRVKLTPYELGEYESGGGQRVDKIIRFATIDCAKAGWMIKQKGRWSLTDEGRQAYKQINDPAEFYRRAARLYREWKATRPDAGGDEGTESAEGQSTEKKVSITYEQAEEQSWEEISQYLRNMKPYDFQDLVAALLRGMGYHVSWVAPPGKDGGVDIHAFTDPLGTRTPRIKVQVKRLKDNVGVDGLRSFMALLGDDDVGLFVTTAGFTKDAQDEARTQQKRKITLVDLERLYDLWIEHYDDLEDSARRRLPLKPIYFLAPDV
jgi:restriction system protein